jgi:hypothetical protein
MKRCKLLLAEPPKENADTQFTSEYFWQLRWHDQAIIGKTCTTMRGKHTWGEHVSLDRVNHER